MGIIPQSLPGLVPTGSRLGGGFASGGFSTKSSSAANSRGWNANPFTDRQQPQAYSAKVNKDIEKPALNIQVPKFHPGNVPMNNSASRPPVAAPVQSNPSLYQNMTEEVPGSAPVATPSRFDQKKVVLERQVGAVIGRVVVLWRVLMTVLKIRWVMNYGKMMMKKIMIIEMILGIIMTIGTEIEIAGTIGVIATTETAITEIWCREIGMIRAIEIDTIETTDVLSIEELTTDGHQMIDGTTRTTGNIDKFCKYF